MCYKCDLLMKLFERTPLTNRDYWVMTELFVLLHDGKDHCLTEPEISDDLINFVRELE